jgi:signal transduction histidine kinase/ActR/RegA family two-component response regulator
MMNVPPAGSASATLLARLLERLERAEAYAQVGSWSYDITTGQGWWSSQMFRFFGLTPDPRAPQFEVYLDRIHPEDRAVVRDALLAMAGGKEPVVHIYRTDPRYGPIRYLQPTYGILHDDDGRMRAFEGTLIDITERARLEALSDGEHQVLERVARQAPLAEILATICRLIEAQLEGGLCSILLLDADGVHIRHGAAPSLPAAYNAAIDGLTIGPEEGSCGTAMYRKVRIEAADIATDPRWVRYREIALSHDLRACWSNPILAKDGSVLGSFAVYYHSPKPSTPADLRVIERATHIASIAIERAKAADDHASMQQRLLQAQKLEAVGRLAGGVAHDFNNILGVILGYAEVELRGKGPTDPGYTAFHEIRNAALRAADLTLQLLAFSRRQTVDPRVLDVNLAIGRCLNLMKRLVGEDIELRFDPGEEVGAVRIDPIQLDQVLTNLAVNSRDAMDGPGTVTFRTARIAAGGKGWVRITCADDGRGIPPDQIEHVFEPFFTTKQVGKGTGLGLATVYGIVEQNGGTIRVESREGSGTTFTILLPREDAAPTESATPPRTIPGGTETILVAEDDPAILELCREMLEAEGYRVLAAATPTLALAIARDQPDPIHLLLTDVVMPTLNGRDLQMRIAEIRPGIATLFMSGYSADVLTARGVLAPGVKLLPKPFSLGDLLRQVREALDGGQDAAASRPPDPGD